MTATDFALCMAVLESATGKQMSAEQTAAYAELLGDLPAPVLMLACKQALLESQYPTIPPVGTIRKLAVAAMGGNGTMDAGEAWKLAWRAACNVDPGNEASYWRDGQIWDNQCAYAMAKLPPLVAEAVKRFGGIKLLANADGKFAREPFMKIFAELSATEQKHKILPPSLKKQLAAIGHEPKPISETTDARVKAIAASVGKSVEES